MSSTDDPTVADTMLPGRSAQPFGYEVGELLGRGGMGEVVLGTDPRIGRNVAIKRMRGESSPEMTARFLREAKIQARLDHPSIVPVHELGEDPDGRPYFTMKRLTGTTLAAVLAEPAEPPQRLLRAFVDVCLAIELAHEQRVVHRDLKPANVMLGNYGEVYVLDWGVARLLDETVDVAGDDPPSLDGRTEAGALLGTPGYMAPEQARGEQVGVLADCYSLGCILFEILTRVPLHPRGAGALASTLTTPTASPASRGPQNGKDVPPELDAVCVEALAELPEHRPSARALADRVQSYLDGDRDLEGRRMLAIEELARARAELSAGDRAAAMHAAGRALALDPRSDAAELVSSLMLEPPKQMPAELEAHLDDLDLTLARRQWRLVGLSFTTFFIFLPLIFWVGVIDPWSIVGMYGTLGLLVASALWWQRRGRPRIVLWMLGGAIAMVFFTRLIGELVLLPAVLVVQLFGYLAYPSLMRRPAIPIAIVAATFLLPVILELTGVFQRTWWYVGDTVVMRSAALELSSGLTPALLISAHVAIILVTGLFAWSLAASRHEAQRQVEIQAWHLRKLLPAA